MKRSTYQNPIPASHGNIAKAHNRQGKPVALPRGYEAMPEMAASGLWTTATDLAKMMLALMDAYRGENTDFLPQALVKDMMTAVAPSNFGLGPVMYTEKIFGHGGSNNSYKAQFAGHLETGNGIVILTNGANGKQVIHKVLAAMKQIEGWAWD